MINFINSSYTRFYNEHKEEILGAITKCLENGDFILRAEVEQFEKSLAEYVGTRFAVGVNSGTDALFLSLKSLGIKEGDEVITVSHTFIATIQVIVHCGAKPILVDVDENGLMNIEQLKNSITPKTKCILPVHLSGRICNMQEIMELGIPVVEDACQALGAVQNGKKAGSFGITGCFSFISPKLMGCYGDAGAVVTNYEAVYEKLLLLRNHWNITQNALLGHQPKAPEIMDWGWNSRLDNIQASVLNVKMKYLSWILWRRAEIAKMYSEGIHNENIKIPVSEEGQVWSEYIIRVKDQFKFRYFMKDKGIELLIRDTTPNHKLKGLGLEQFNLPVTEQMAIEEVRLPIYPELEDTEVRYIINAINQYE